MLDRLLRRGLVPAILVGLLWLPASARAECCGETEEDGLLAVVVFSDDEFDAAEVDEETLLDSLELELAGLPPVPPLASFLEDVNGNGLEDLVVLYDLQEAQSKGAVSKKVSMRRRAAARKRFENAPVVLQCLERVEGDFELAPGLALVLCIRKIEVREEADGEWPLEEESPFDEVDREEHLEEQSP